MVCMRVIERPCRRTIVRASSEEAGATPTNPASSGDDDGEPLPSFAVLQQRMAKLRALDDYRDYLDECRDQPLKAGEVQVDLFRAAMLIARHRHPDLDEAASYAKLDAIAQMVQEELKGGPRYPLKVVRAINSVLYGQLGYKGAEQEEYYSADNSCMNMVLERRTGIPITLSLVYMEVAKRVGLRVVGCNFPSHFMLRVLGSAPEASTASGSSSPEQQSEAAGAGSNDAGGSTSEEESGPLELFVDAFKEGEVGYIGDVEETLSGVLGADVKLDRGWLEADSGIDAVTFLMRMLNNLKHVYFMTNAVEDALAIIRYMRCTNPAHMTDVRDEGLCLFALERYVECAECLSTYLQALDSTGKAADDQERSMITMLLSRVRGIMREGSKGELDTGS